MRNRRRLYRFVMARTAASSRPRARSTRSSSLSASAAACWPFVKGMSGILRFDTLDASAAKRFLGVSSSKQHPLPVIFCIGPPGARTRARRRFGDRLGVRGASSCRSTSCGTVVRCAVDRGRDLIGLEQIVRRRARSAPPRFRRRHLRNRATDRRRPAARSPACVRGCGPACDWRASSRWPRFPFPRHWARSRFPTDRQRRAAAPDFARTK